MSHIGVVKVVLVAEVFGTTGGSMENLRKHFDLLGMKVTDRISGISGVVTSLCFDLYGCIQGSIHPGADKDGKAKDVCWYDVSRLEVVSKKPVMDPPKFDFSPAAVSAGRKGPAEKPAAKA